MVAKNWLLSEDIVLAIRHHHDPAAAALPEPVARLCALLNFAIHVHNRRANTGDGEWENIWKAEASRRLGLSENDLADPQLLNECRTALDELTQILKLGAVYPFQLA